MPKDTPALYSLINYADLSLGTWYPMGGMYKFIEAFEKIALEQCVIIKKNSEVLSFEYSGNKAIAAITTTEKYEADIFISGADYQHTEASLLRDKANYDDSYWNSRTMAPSSLIFYVGIDKKVEKLNHHNLSFDESLEAHG